MLPAHVKTADLFGPGSRVYAKYFQPDPVCTGAKFGISSKKERNQTDPVLLCTGSKKTMTESFFKFSVLLDAVHTRADPFGFVPKLVLMAFRTHENTVIRSSLARHHHHNQGRCEVIWNGISTPTTTIPTTSVVIIITITLII